MLLIDGVVNAAALNCAYGSLLWPEPGSPEMTTRALSTLVVPVSVYGEMPGIAYVTVYGVPDPAR